MLTFCCVTLSTVVRPQRPFEPAESLPADALPTSSPAGRLPLRVLPSRGALATPPPGRASPPGGPPTPRPSRPPPPWAGAGAPASPPGVPTDPNEHFFREGSNHVDERVLRALLRQGREELPVRDPAPGQPARPVCAAGERH